VPNGALVLVNCFVLRFSRKAKFAQKVVRFDPTMVSLPLDARRTKWQWSFDRFACLTCNFAPDRRLSREMHCRRRQGQEKHLRPTVKKYINHASCAGLVGSHKPICHEAQTYLRQIDVFTRVTDQKMANGLLAPPTALEGTHGLCP
jgi:hypothetical protein